MMITRTDLKLISKEILANKGVMMRICGEGASMQPLIKSKDFILIRHIELQELAIGDILVWCTPSDEMIAHRLEIIQRDHKGMILITKGDSRLLFDPQVDEAEVIGKVVAIEKNNLTINLNSKSLHAISCTIVMFSSAISIIYTKCITSNNNILAYFGPKILVVINNLFLNMLVNSFLITAYIKESIRAFAKTCHYGR